MHYYQMKGVQHMCYYQLLHDKVLGLNSRAISCGFDQAAISAMEECFPEVTIKGFFSI